MKINLNQISYEGSNLEERIPARSLDLETDLVKFRGPLLVKARIHKITNAVTVDLDITAPLYSICSRCLDEFDYDLKKSLQLNYQTDKSTLSIDLNPDIREEVILEYPLKPLCNLGCKGLCPKCGSNLNEKSCNCK